MTRTIAIANQKGGTGKTTTAVNLAAGLARFSQMRVLFVDLDPQANATAVFFGAPFVAGPNPGHTVYDVLLRNIAAGEAIRTVTLAEYKRHNLPEASLDILPAHIKLAIAEQELLAEFQRESKLQSKLQSIVDRYDLIVLDCPPSLGLLTINGLMSATDLIVPIEPGIFPLIGLGLLRRTIETVQGANTALKLSGVLPVRTNRTNLSTNTLNELAQNFPDMLLPAIPERVVIGEAHAQGEDIFLYAPTSEAAQAYQKLVEEVLSRA